MRPQSLNSLFIPVSSLDGVGPKIEKVMTKLFHGATPNAQATLRDLVFHLPHSIIDRRRQPEIINAPQASIVTLKVRIDRHQPPPRGNRRVPYRVFVHDDSGELALIFFSAHTDYLQRSLPVGEIRYISGKVEWFNARPTMIHPDHVVDEEAFASLPLVEPVYPNTAGLAQKTLQKSVRSALEKLPDLPEWTDHDLLKKQGWSGFGKALRQIHLPRDEIDISPDAPHRCRLAHDEFLAGQLALALTRERMRKNAGVQRHFDGTLARSILENFPWPLTNAQNTALEEIRNDLVKPQRMLRLLQGDVGAGKTIIALLAAADVIEGGAQASIMAPTEILARQHLASIAPLCQETPIKPAILTGREKGKAREEILQALTTGEINLLIGTHALFQGPVEFKDLGLAVIDEQHRFGVHQRLALGDKAPSSDVLVMTATPIPRTLVMTWYGDMEVSRLTDKPVGRKPITTSALPLDRLDDLVMRIAKAIQSGQKIYWVCPLVEDSEELDITSAQQCYDHLATHFNQQVGLVHGRMSSAKKDEAMEAFKSGQTRILVATTVIEVGVDVPDATIIVIEHAERFGLAQLHQLRGRVGRNELNSHCILLYKAPLGQIANARLAIMRETNDGFLIAEEDLRLRGEGEVLGTKQSGTPGFNLASVEHHSQILEIANNSARHIMATNPRLEGEKGDALKTLLYLFGQDQAIRLIRSG